MSPGMEKKGEMCLPGSFSSIISKKRVSPGMELNLQVALSSPSGNQSLASCTVAIQPSLEIKGGSAPLGSTTTHR